MEAASRDQPRSAWRRLLGGAGSLVIAALLFEGTVRLALLTPGASAKLPCRHQARDALCELSGFLRWIDNGAHSSGANPDEVHHPIYGHRVFADRIPEHEVNAQGLRAEGIVSEFAPAGKQRVLLLGDSFVFGSETAGDEVYTTLLAELRPDLDLVNLGIPSFGHDGMLLRYRHDGRAFHPDIVLIGENVLLALRDSMGFYLGKKPRFELHDGELVLTGVPVEPPTERWKRLRWQSWAGLGLHALWQQVVEPRPELHGEWALSGALLDTLIAEIEADGAVAMVVSIPTLEEHFVAGGFFDLEHDAWEAWCVRTGAPCVDVLPRFAEAWGNGVDTRRGGHWNAIGHRLYAEELARVIPVGPDEIELQSGDP